MAIAWELEVLLLFENTNKLSLFQSSLKPRAYLSDFTEKYEVLSKNQHF